MRREWLEKDYYATLGVAPNASDSEIRTAFRKLAQQYHPDAKPGDTAAEERFKEINEAYAVVGDKEQRKEYDQVRTMGAEFIGGPGGTQYVRVEDLSDLFGGAGDSGLGSIFGGLGDIFGGGTGRRRRPSRGRDREADITLSFHEAISGATKELTVDGRRIKVKVPAGVNDMARIRIAGKGDPSPNGGEAGDLFVRVHVADHPFFKRADANLHLTVPVSFPEAALGANIDVPTLDGKVTLKIPPGTPNGKTFRVTGKGAPKPKGGAGDLLVTVEVEVPTELESEERALLEQLRDRSAGHNPRARFGV